MARNDLIGDIPPSLSISSPARGGFRKETQDSFFQVPFLLYIFLFASFFCFVFVVTPKLRKLAKVSIDGERGKKKLLYPRLYSGRKQLMNVRFQLSTGRHFLHSF